MICIHKYKLTLDKKMNKILIYVIATTLKKIGPQPYHISDSAAVLVASRFFIGGVSIPTSTYL